jgi:SAM-dependent methyltransferase
MKRVFEKNGYQIVECESCRHQSTEMQPTEDHVNQVYGDEYFHGGGAGYAGYLEEGKLLRERGRWYAKLLSKYVEPGCVLDVGAAAGFVAKGLTDSGWQAIGLEPNANMVSYGRDSLRLDMQQGTLENFRHAKHFDLVTMIQVLPHFYDPRRALECAATMTQPGGHWLVETWDRQSLTARTLGKHWHEYSPPSVLHWFSRSGVESLANQFGFSQVAHGRPPKWISGAHARSLLAYSSQNLPVKNLVRGLARVIPADLTLPYPAEDLVWMLFRKADTTFEQPTAAEDWGRCASQ